MKIIFLEAVQNYGGARISTLELAERLSSDNEVLILDFYGSCEPFLNNVNKRNLQIKIIDKREQPVIIRSSLSYMKNAVNLLRFIPHWFTLRKRTLNHLKDFNPDFILVNNYKTLSVLSGSGWKSKILFFARGWSIRHKISSFNRILLKYSVERYICVAEATRHALYAGNFASLENLYLVHNAVDEETLPKETIVLKDSERQTVILHAGGFLPEKGQHVSVEVIKRLREKNIDAKLILAGLIYKGERSEKYFQNIVEKIKFYNLDDVVEIVKDKPNVIPYFRGCDIVIHPSATEGLPRVVMEGMCLKKPVIANAVGGVIDYILSGYTGYTTRFNNVDDYVEHIEKLISDREHYQFIAENGYNLVRSSYTPENQVKSFMQIFQNIKK